MFPASAPVVVGAPSDFRLRTAVRVRGSADPGACVTALDAESVRAVDPESGRGHDFTFAFDAVLGPEATQDDAHERLLAPLMPGFLHSTTENTCVMAYGPTGAGKSHTMDGLLERAAAELFDAPPALVRVRFVNICNARITDLLRWVQRKPESARDRFESRADLHIHRTRERRVHVPELSEHLATTLGELLALVEKGRQESVVRATHMGASCSREHRILSLRLERPDSASTLTLVDLAGSERVDAMGMSGEARVEACRVGMSLGALGNVLSALPTRARHVPYRDSKLTQLLQCVLGRNCEALVVGHVSPCTYDDSLSTLQFVERVAQVGNSSSGPGAGEPVRLLQILEELELLRAELSEAVGEEAEALQGCVETLEGLIANI